MNKLTKEQRDASVRYLLEKNAPYTFDDLVTVVELLRSEGGCPWDMEQTHKSIRNDFIEETYEVIEAIDTEDPVLLREELGDVLLQVVFHAEMAAEESRFCYDDVVDGICKKLIVRHPHVFGDVKADTAGEVLKNWDAIKRQTKGTTAQSTLLKHLPRTLPALMRAAKVQDRARRVGFDWPSVDGALQALESETAESSTAPRRPTMIVSITCTSCCPANDNITGNAIRRFSM